MSMSGCCAYGCPSSARKKTGISYHLFPKDKIRRKAWTVAVKRKNFTPGNFTRLCSEHFAEECFDRSGRVVRLKSNAVPTIFKHFPENIQNISTMAPLTDFLSKDVIIKEEVLNEDNNFEEIVEDGLEDEKGNLEGNVDRLEDEEDNLEENINDSLDYNVIESLEDENLDSLPESLSSDEESISDEELPETDVDYVPEEKIGIRASKPRRTVKVVPNGVSGEMLTPSKANLDKKILDALSSYLKNQECSGVPDTQEGPTVSVIFVQPPANEAYPLIPCGPKLRQRRKPNNLEYRILNQTRKIKAMNQMNEKYLVKIAQLERTIENFKNPTTSDEDDLSEDDITVDEIYHEMLKRQRLEDDVES